MATTQHPPGSPSSSLLHFFDSFSIEEDILITGSDLKFCEEQQNLLYETLGRIERWYGIFREEAGLYTGTHNLSYTVGGKVILSGLANSGNLMSPDYKRFEFQPFDLIDKMAGNRCSAIRNFAGNIIGYFNKTYHVSIPVPEAETQEFPLGFRPVYTTYTSLVEKHLRGKGFRQTAEEELLQRFHNTVSGSYWKQKMPELVKDKIVFHNIICFDEYYFQYGKNKIHYNCNQVLEIFCEGIAFGVTASLNGSTAIIPGFNGSNVDISNPYPLTTGNAVGMKFYKNGRIDIRFPDSVSAEACFKKLKLNELTPKEK
jgi:hypothetical protein